MVNQVVLDQQLVRVVVGVQAVSDGMIHFVARPVPAESSIGVNPHKIVVNVVEENIAADLDEIEKTVGRARREKYSRRIHHFPNKTVGLRVVRPEVTDVTAD